jgi:hypothetical protein
MPYCKRFALPTDALLLNSSRQKVVSTHGPAPREQARLLVR